MNGRKPILAMLIEECTWRSAGAVFPLKRSEKRGICSKQFSVATTQQKNYIV